MSVVASRYGHISVEPHLSQTRRRRVNQDVKRLVILVANVRAGHTTTITTRMVLGPLACVVHDVARRGGRRGGAGQ